MRTLTISISGVVLASLGTASLAQDRTLTFTSFGGSYQEAQREALLDPLEASEGVTFLENTLTGIAEVRAQVRSGAVNWDIVDLGHADCEAAEAEGLFEPLDYNLISTEGFDEDAFSEGWIGTIYFSTVLGHSTEAFPDGGPGTWAEFWDVEAFPGARSLRNSPLGTLEIALLADGVPFDELYPIDYDRAFAKLDEIKPHIDVWWTSGAQSAQLLSDGEVDMISAWNGRLDAAADDGAPVTYTFEQGLASLDCLAIPKGAPNKELAMEMVAKMVSPELAANIPTYINYGPTTELAFESDKITQALRDKSPSSPANLELQGLIDAEWWGENRREAQERWDAWITR